MIRMFIFVLFGVLAFGQPDANELMRRAIDADLRNDEKTPEYTFRQHRTVRAFNANGQETGSATWLWDVVPLKRYDNVDRKLIQSSGERVSLNLDYEINVGPGMIPGLFDLSIVRQESLRGRTNWVLLAAAKDKVKTKSDNEKELINYRFTIWIDQEDNFPAQMRMEIVNDKSRLEKGSAWQWFHERNADGVWLFQESRFRYASKGRRLSARGVGRSSRGEIHDTYSDYRKFDVKSRIVE